MKRENGFYWVKRGESWIVAEWNSVYWYISGNENGLNESELEVIDERRIVRGNAYVDLSNDALLEAKKELDCSDDTFEWIVVLASWYDIPLEDILEKYRNI